MQKQPPHVLIGSMKSRILEIERLDELNLERGNNVGRHQMMATQISFLIQEAGELKDFIQAPEHHQISWEN